MNKFLNIKKTYFVLQKEINKKEVICSIFMLQLLLFLYMGLFLCTKKMSGKNNVNETIELDGIAPSNINHSIISKKESIKSYLRDFNANNSGTSVPGFVKLLKKMEIRMVVFDFDQTIIGAHSRGFLDISNDEDHIATAVTVDFQLFSNLLQENKIKIAVATFSDEEAIRNSDRRSSLIAGAELVRYCLLKSGCDASIEGVYAYYPHCYKSVQQYKKLGLDKPMSNDKSYHLKRIREDFSLRIDELIFIDDDVNNCESARNEGYITLHVLGNDGFNFKRIRVL